VPVDAVGSAAGVRENITELCEDANLQVLLTDDVDNLSVRFQRVKVTGEDISGVKLLPLFHTMQLPSRRRLFTELHSTLDKSEMKPGQDF